MTEVTLVSSRDLSLLEFINALHRNGFRRTPLGLWFEDDTGQTPGVCYGAVLKPSGGIDRRQTLSRIIREREQRAVKAQYR